jgi:hypothetical protein
MKLTLQRWDESFAGCEPIGARLRVAFADRWVRFHYLPESKRSAETEEEVEMALHRYDVVLDDLNRSQQAVALVTTGYSDSVRPIRSYPILSGLDGAAMPWRTVRVDDAAEDKTFWHFFVSPHEWKPAHLTALLRAVIEDQLADVLVVATDCSWVLHPYQGGMDVIFKSARDRDELARKRSAWIPANLEGL